MDFDRLATSAPLNRQAAQDYNATGDGWAPERKANVIRFDGPPPLAPITASHRRNPSFVDQTGRRVGRLVVLGRIDRDAAGIVNRDDRGAAWAVRCNCGAYEYRRAKKLKTYTADGFHMCSDCSYVEDLKAGRVRTKTVAERLGRARR